MRLSIRLQYMVTCTRIQYSTCVPVQNNTFVPVLVETHGCEYNEASAKQTKTELKWSQYSIDSGPGT